MKKHIKDELILRDLDKLINCEHTAFGLPSGVQPELCKQEDWLYNRGMPIGNLTSQMFANIYLNESDQFCKHVLHIEKIYSVCRRRDRAFDSKEKGVRGKG